MGILDRMKAALVTKTAEGAVSSGPFLLPISGGLLDDGGNWNWWQRGIDVQSVGRSAMIEACISAYAQTTAMLPGDHWSLKDNGGRERVTTSSLSRILKQGPNSYQTLSDFLLNAIDNLYSDGNAYALALRNSRQEITELHLMNPRQSFGRVASTGDVFYALGGNEVIDYQLREYPLLVPERDVLHLKLRTSPFNMLLGESPIVSAARDSATSNAILQQQLAFYTNQARPSMVLSSDLVLTAEQVQQIRDRWNEQSRQLGAGGTVVLGAGMKPIPMSQNSVDSQLAEVMKMSDQKIALAFRVPLQVLGIGGTTASSSEDLMSIWLAGGLNFCLNHLETAMDALFGLAGYPQEYVEFDTSALLRSAMKDRVEAFARGVQGGIYAPNEARAEFGLKEMPYGDDPRVQQQMVPLSAAAAIPAAPPAPSPPAALPAPAKDIFDAERLRSRFRSSQSRSFTL